MGKYENGEILELAHRSRRSQFQYTVVIHSQSSTTCIRHHAQITEAEMRPEFVSRVEPEVPVAIGVAVGPQVEVVRAPLVVLVIAVAAEEVHKQQAVPRQGPLWAQQVEQTHSLEHRPPALASWPVAVDCKAWTPPWCLGSSLEDERAAPRKDRGQAQNSWSWKGTERTWRGVGTEGIHSSPAVDTKGAPRLDVAAEGVLRAERAGEPLRRDGELPERFAAEPLAL